MVGPCPSQSLPDPLGKGHAVSAGNVPNLVVLFLIQEDLKTLRHKNSLSDSSKISQLRTSGEGVYEEPVSETGWCLMVGTLGWPGRLKSEAQV